MKEFTAKKELTLEQREAMKSVIRIAEHLERMDQPGEEGFDEDVSKYIAGIDTSDKCEMCRGEISFYIPGDFSEYCLSCRPIMMAYLSEDETEALI